MYEIKNRVAKVIYIYLYRIISEICLVGKQVECENKVLIALIPTKLFTKFILWEQLMNLYFSHENKKSSDNFYTFK